MKMDTQERLQGILASYRSKSMRQRAEHRSMPADTINMHEMGDIYSFEMKPAFDAIKEELMRYSYDMAYKEDIDPQKGILIVDLSLGIGADPDLGEGRRPGMRYTLSSTSGTATIEMFRAGFAGQGRTSATHRFDQISRDRVMNQVLDLLEQACERQLLDEKRDLQHETKDAQDKGAPGKAGAELEFSLDDDDPDTRIAKFKERTGQ